MGCPTGTTYDNSTKLCKGLQPNISNTTGNTIGTVNPTANDIQCPTDTPFFNGTNCITCPPATPYFDLSKTQCINCPAGQSYQPSSKSCQNLPPTISNPDSSTIGIVNRSPTDIPCPVAAPFLKDGKCITCPTDTPYFNLANTACENCSTDFAYDNTTKSCISQLANASNPSGANRTIGTIPAAGPNDLLCPPETPFFIDNTCINCTDPTPYYFPFAGDCAACPTDQKYDVTTHSCITPVTTPTTPSTLPLASNLTASNKWTSSRPYGDLV